MFRYRHTFILANILGIKNSVFERREKLLAQFIVEDHIILFREFGKKDPFPNFSTHLSSHNLLSSLSIWPRMRFRSLIGT